MYGGKVGGDTISCKLKGSGRRRAPGDDKPSALIAVVEFGTEIDHVKLTIEHRPEDTARFRFDDGIAVKQLGVIEFRGEVYSGGTITMVGVLTIFV